MGSTRCPEEVVGVRSLLRPAGQLLVQWCTAKEAMGTTMSVEYAELLDVIAFGATGHRNQRRKGAEASPFIDPLRQLTHGLVTGGASATS